MHDQGRHVIYFTDFTLLAVVAIIQLMKFDCINGRAFQGLGLYEQPFSLGKRFFIT